ncbi:MAG: hypothetical protein WC781_02285 [Candidatus Pacearchaeota archaeon]|jgi:hypothetical protein
MEQELQIEGYRYSGRFKIEEHSHTYTDWIDSEVGRYPQTTTNRWWEGQGIITDKQTGNFQKFLISLDHNQTLGENKEQIQIGIDYAKIIDSSLGSMYELAEKSEDIIPRIKPATESLVGLLKEE